jgi:uncharacterized protein (TIGR03067 family)
MDVDGKRIAEKNFEDSRLILDRGRLTLLYKGEVLASGKVTFDPKKSPSEITVEFTDGTHKGKRSLGIYHLEYGQLTICWTLIAVARERPTRFETAPKSGLSLVVYLNCRRLS